MHMFTLGSFFIKICTREQIMYSRDKQNNKHKHKQ